MALTEPLSEGIAAGPMVAKLTDPLGARLLERTRVFRDRVKGSGGVIEDGYLENLFDPIYQKVKDWGLESDLEFFGSASAVENNSGSIPKIFDGSGNELDAVQNDSAKQPALNKNGVGGHWEGSGDGTDDSWATANDIIISEPITEIAVGTIPGDGDALISGSQYSSTNGSILIYNYENSNEWAVYSGLSVSGGSKDTNPHAFSAVFKGTDTLRVDKTQVLSGDAGSRDVEGFDIFTYDGNRHNSGVLLGALVFSTELSPQRQDKLASYLMDYYGI